MTEATPPLKPQLSAPLLVELLTEELPPKALAQLSQHFAQSIFDGLNHLGLLSPSSKMTAFGTPRRLGVHISEVLACAAPQAKTVKLMPKAVGLNSEGQATASLLKKLDSLNLSHLQGDALFSSLSSEHDGKQEQLFLRYTAAGVALPQGLQQTLDEAIRSLPIPKTMHYQQPDPRLGPQAPWLNYAFVRPAHGLIALHGSDIVEVKALGHQAGRRTLGHRFMCQAPLEISHADEYANTLEKQGFVRASLSERRAFILRELREKAAPDQLVAPDALVDEVTALTEWPVILSASFDAGFLKVPQECLILTMQTNQKYFALVRPACAVDQGGTLINRFLLVSNLASSRPATVIQGNERVLRARLSDAQFFFEQDLKQPLLSRLPKLAKVVYHRQLGSQGERIERLQQLATAIAAELRQAREQWPEWSSLNELVLDAEAVSTAANLCKADLVTEMVGEFPELQGIIGRLYAQQDGHPATVADAVAEHYQPRFAGDALPGQGVAICLALADKLETLVGLFGIGALPSGDKDPYALRRHALGVLRIIIEKRLPIALPTCIRLAADCFGDKIALDQAVLIAFFKERLRQYLSDQLAQPDEIKALIDQDNLSQADALLSLPERLKAVQAFRLSPACASLAAANKRIHNILKKLPAQDLSSLTSAGWTLGGDALQKLDKATDLDAGEKPLITELATLSPIARRAFQERRYQDALMTLSVLQTPVNTFFEQTMVMAEDVSVRQRRLGMLKVCHELMNQLADLSALAV